MVVCVKEGRHSRCLSDMYHHNVSLRVTDVVFLIGYIVGYDPCLVCKSLFAVIIGSLMMMA